MTKFKSNFNRDSRYYGTFKIFSRYYEQDVEWAQGVLNIVNNHIYVTIFGIRDFCPHKYFKHNGDTLLGHLLNGYHILCRNFILIRRIEHKDSFLNKFLLYNMDVSNVTVPFSFGPNINKLNSIAIDNGIGSCSSHVDITQFQQWSYDPKYYRKSNSYKYNYLYNLGAIYFNKDLYHIYINFYIINKSSIYFDTLEENHSDLCIVSPTGNYSNINIISRELLILLEILMNRNLNIIQICNKRMEKDTNRKYLTTYIPSLFTNPPYCYYDYKIGALSFFHLKTHDLSNIVNSFINRFDDLKPFIKALFNDNYTGISSEFNLIAYMSAIDIYYRDARYSSNNKRIKELDSKIECKFLNEIPNCLQNKIFHKFNLKEIDKYVYKLVKTRDYYVHGIHSNYILKGRDLSLSLKILRLLVYSFILIKINIPEYLVEKFMSQLE